VILPRVVVASDVDWRIHWQEDGILHEEVKIMGPDIVASDHDWDIRREGNQNLLQREVKWSSYQESQDRLPLQIKQNNYIVFKLTQIDISGNAGGMYSHLIGLDGFELTIVTPGIIISTYGGNQINESSSKWVFSNSTELLEENRVLKFIMIDGFLLGIVILFFGLLVIVIKFIRHLKNAERIIEEEYSLSNIKPMCIEEKDANKSENK
jgi:hypothetical protein